MSTKLTERMADALLKAEDTLFGDAKIAPGFGRQIKGLRNRGMIEGEAPHIYLTDAGKETARSLRE